MDESAVVRITEIDNEVEAGLLDELLEERGIPHIIRCFHDAVYDGVFQVQQGWGCVLAPEEHRKDIEAILHDIRARFPADGDGA